MKIFHKNREVDIDAKKVSALGKITGLMFRSAGTKSLLFEFRKGTRTPIHSCFVFFPFLAVWLDKNDRVIESRVVRPFSMSVKPGRNFRKLVEIPVNRGNEKIIDFLVGKGKI